jgi:hypothetical protein
MAKGFKELDANPEAHALEHPEWLALLLEHKTTPRRQKRFEARARAARPGQQPESYSISAAYIMPACLSPSHQSLPDLLCLASSTAYFLAHFV